MKKIFSLLLCVVIAAALLVSCGETDTHGHEFVDANSDSICDVCNSDGAATHGHAFADADVDGSCDVCNADGAASHGHNFVDANKDKVCDSCASVAHSHVYSPDWSYDANNHWHAALCAHGTEKADIAAHEIDALGVCVVCGLGADELDVADAIEIALDNAGLIGNGTIAIVNDYGIGYLNSQNFSYEFGNDVFKYIEFSEYGDTEYWYSLAADGTVFGVTEYDGYASPAYEPVEDDLLGYKFYVLGLEFYGVEGLVEGIYAIAEENANGDASMYITEVDGENVYTISFGMFYEGEFNIVSLEFSLSDEFAIDNVTLTIDMFNSIYDEWLEEYYYGYVQNEDGTYAATWINPAVTTLYTIEQEVCERTLENEYVAEEMIASDFVLMDDSEVELPATGNAAFAGVSYNYILGGFVPETVNPEFNNISYIVTLNGEEAYEWVDFSVNSWGTDFSIEFYGAGTYSVTLNYGFATKTYEFEVTIPDATEISAFVDGEAISEATIFVGTDFVFTVQDVNNAYANCNYAVSVASANASIVSEFGSNTFTATAAGMYIVSIVADNEVTAALLITVEEAPAIEDILNGEYEYSFYGSSLFDVVFTPDSEGALTGTVVISTDNYYYMDVAGTFTYTYDAETGALTLTNVDDEENVNYSFAVINYELCYDGEALSRPAEELTEFFFVDKTYTNGEWYISFTAYEDIFTVNVMDVPMGKPSNAQSYTYSIVKLYGGYEIVLVENGEALNEPLVILEMYYDVEADKITVTTTGFEQIDFTEYNPFA